MFCQCVSESDNFIVFNINLSKVYVCFANSQLPVTSTMRLIVLIFLTCFTEFTPARLMLVTEISLEDIFLYKGCGDPICNQVCWLKVS